MTDVTRYSIADLWLGAELQRDQSGEWTRASDYDALERKWKVAECVIRNFCDDWHESCEEGCDEVAPTSLASELVTVLNRNSRENVSNTPDFIIAEFLVRSLTALERAITARVEWHGRAMFPSMTDNDVLAKTAAEHLSTRASLQDKLAKYEALAARAARCRSVRPSYDPDEMQRIVDALAEMGE